MGLFKKKSGSVPNRAASPVRRPASSSSEFLVKKPVNTPETQHAEAMRNWRNNNNKAQNAWASSDSQIKGIEKSMSEKRKPSSGGTVTAEGGRAIDTGRM